MKKLKLFLFVSLTCLVVISISTYDESSRLKHEKLRFHVNESDALFFRNMRQYFYSIELREDAGFDLFRLKKQSETCKGDSCLHFIIVNNWRQDMAYLKPESKPEFSARFRIESDKEVTFSVIELNSEQSLALGFETYQALLNPESRFFLLSESGKMEIWSSKLERDQTKAVLKDYFKLTGAL